MSVPGKIVLALLAASLMASCSFFDKKKQGDAVAKAYDKYLYRSDIQGIVPPGTPANDSIEIVHRFIDNWIHRQVVLNQAESNLSPEQKDFGEQLEAYRNSLIVYGYESELIRQKLDTVVSQLQIQEFYDKNPQNFQLRENIVRVSYVKIPQASASLAPAKKATQLLKSGKAPDIDKLDELCQSSMLVCRLDDENWISFNDLQREIPITVDNQDNFLQNRSFFETSDSLYVYVVRIIDFKMKESLSPLSFETENIRNIIINRRKLELINQMEQEVFQKALENKDFQIF
ncbi:MAG: hypothetical protein IPH20_12100 [Bacteroidales bacterium]|nr:hypothetical protein [Bacteroidales bacterium]